jgi:hypothetical protein
MSTDLPLMFKDLYCNNDVKRSPVPLEACSVTMISTAPALNSADLTATMVSTDIHLTLLVLTVLMISTDLPLMLEDLSATIFVNRSPLTL